MSEQETHKATDSRTLENIPAGEIFYIRGDIENPKLRTREGYVDLRYRHEEPCKEGVECVLITTEMLCVIMHHLEIVEWVDGAKAFFIPPLEGEEVT